MELDPRNPEKLLRLKEVAAALGVNVRTIRRWLEEKKFPPPDRVLFGLRNWSARRVLAWLELRDWLEPEPSKQSGQKRT